MTQLLDLTMGGLLDQVTAKHRGKEALVDLPSNTRLTYGQFLDQVNSLAKGLLHLGLQPGDHLALWAPNRPEWLICMFAAAKAGVVLTNLDTGLAKDQVQYLLADSNAKALILAPGIQGREYLEAMEEICPEAAQAHEGGLECEALPDLAHVILMDAQARAGMQSLAEVSRAGGSVPDQELDQRQKHLSSHDVSSLIYTSGTTGAPKGVMVTHHGLINVSLASARNQGLGEEDRLCLSVPLSHMFGCICVALTGISQGAALVFPGPMPEPGTVLQAVEQERCSAVYGTPTSFLNMMDHPTYKDRDISSLRTGIMGGAVCPLELMKRVVEEMGVRRILCGYGQTEASSWVTQTSPQDPLELRVSTAGRALPGVELKVISPASGAEVPPGEVGEVCARGFVMKGYYHLPAATAGAVDGGGWLHTGDLATLDEKGYLRISGRVKEAITKGNDMIFPSDVEEVLFTHPRVLNAQVFAVPDPELGEEVAVWIKVVNGEELSPKEIVEFCNRNLPAALVPRYIKFVQEFPMTPLGKIQKVKMTELYAAELDLS
jgi:fatty-acyl-CoA synthase